ncbi:MAG: tetratricopeptide repeat protein [Phycisphaeraceae bacterium]
MKLSRIPFAVLTAVLITTVLVGCNNTTNNREQWVKEADGRWNTVKSSIAVQMAEDQFNAGQLGLAQKTIEEAMVNDMENPQLWLMGGRIALEKSELETAYQRLAKAIEYGEERENYSTKDKANPHYFQGIVDQRWQRYDSAKEKYTQAYERDPENVAYFLAKVEMLVQLGQLTEATTELESKTTYFDQNATVRALLGHVYRRQASHDKAAMWFKQASMLAPEDMKLKEEVARSQMEVGRYDEAARGLSELVETEYGAKRTDLHRLLAEGLVKAGKIREATKQYNTLTSLDPTSIHDWSKLGELSYRLGDEGTSLQAANRLINLAPDDHRGYLLAGMVWNKRDRLDRALSMFDRAAELAPTDTTPLILRGIALQKNERPAAAADAYKQALSIDPGNKRAQHLLTSVTEGLR